MKKKKKKDATELEIENIHQRRRAVRRASKFVTEQGFRMAFVLLTVSWLSIFATLVSIEMLWDISISTGQLNLFSLDESGWLFGVGSVFVIAFCFAVIFTMFNGFITHVLLKLLKLCSFQIRHNSLIF